MTELEFVSYHNRHIMFRLKNGSEHSGVLVNSMGEFDTGKNTYEFIPTGNMIEYHKAQTAGDMERMKKLKSQIDLDDVVWAQHHRH